MSSIKRLAVLLAVAALTLAVCSLAFAVEDEPYDSSASSRGGAGIEGVLSSGSSADSSADNSGTSAHSSGSSYEVLGTELSSAPECSASRTAAQKQGNATETKSGSFQIIGDETTPATVTLFSSSCYVMAQSNNNSHAIGSGSLADVSAPGVARVTLFGSYSQTDTTNGDASSSTSSDAASVSLSDGTSATALHCSSSQTANNDGTSGASESWLLLSGDQTLDFPDEAGCPTGESEATYTRG